MELARALQLPFTNTQGVLNQRKSLFSELLVKSAFVNPYTPELPLLSDPESRRAAYKLWWAYYDNTIYNPQEWGGYRDIINTWLGDSKTGNLASLFNPVERAVRAYEYVFDGKFGEDVLIDDLADRDKPVLEKTREAIYEIWNWSNINSWKNKLLLHTACLGTSAIRIVMRESDLDGKRIMMLPEHPANILYVEKDDRGHITQIVLEYEKVEGEFYGELNEKNPEGRTLHKYIEYMSKEKFWMIRDGEWWNYKLQKNVDTKEEATIANTLGIVPYVLVLQDDRGSEFGAPCFYGQERKIDHINALTAHINYQIHKHVVPTWLIEGGGPAPDYLPLGDQNILYVQKEAGVSSQVAVHDLVSKMDLSKAIEQQTALLSELSNSMPELKATDGEFLSHQSGDTVAQLRTPAEQRILNARASIESAFIKAQKIAISLGILHGVFDLGTGTGTRATADKAFSAGLEDHKFNTRPALPLTVNDKLTLSKAKQAEAAAENPDVPGVQGGDNSGIVSSTSGKA
jgi:hypothetical protein